jgi:hypothetical protein
MPISKNPEDYTLPPPRPRRHIDDSNWAAEHINELTQQYPEMWVAILDKEVVSASKNLGDVFRVAKEKESEVGRGPCVYKFIEDFKRFCYPVEVSNPG